VASTGRSILIVGAGPVGLVAALELARRGFTPRIVDDGAGPPPPNQSRALGVNARSLTLLSACGVSERIVAHAQDLAQFRICSQSAVLVEVDTRKVAGRFPAICALSQSTTERLLAEGLADHGIVPEWGTSLDDICGDAGRPVVRLRRARGGTETVRPDIVIGADGAHSAVRKAIGLGFPGQGAGSHLLSRRFPICATNRRDKRRDHAPQSRDARPPAGIGRHVTLYFDPRRL
jgi:2-polyprenyl-6-methoxyphenol hydroxylase-like FAD-dependent oxidoreductase